MQRTQGYRKHRPVYRDTEIQRTQGYMARIQRTQGYRRMQIVKYRTCTRLTERSQVER